jgi:hypothetical protein
MNVVYLWLIIFLVVDGVLVNSEVILVTDLLNLKITIGTVFRKCSYR